MNEKIVLTEWGEAVYRKRDGGLFLSEYKLAGANRLWEVMATYATSLPPVPYYVVAKTSRAAKRKFVMTFPWLNVIHSVMRLNQEGQDIVTHNPAHHIII